MKHLPATLLFSIALLFSSCTETKSPDNSSDTTVLPDDDMLKAEAKIFSFPSPVQTAILLRKANTKFNQDLLHPTSKAASYSTSYHKCLNLGIYGSDLAYLTNFGNETKSAEYFKTVEGIATDMGITSSLDPMLLKRFYDNISNRDSLYALNSEFFRAANAYLKDVEQEEQASLILTGGWIEALHLSIDAAEIDKTVRRRVGEQKAALESLIELLSSSKDEAIVGLSSDLTQLKIVYDAIPAQYTYVAPISDSGTKTTYIKSTSQVDVTDEQLKALKEKVSVLRSKITA